MSEISLPALFRGSLQTASRSVNLPTIEDETQVCNPLRSALDGRLILQPSFLQELVQSALRDFREVHSRIRNLSLFSPNESLDDISTRDLVYLTLPYVLADVENRVRTTERPDRMATLAKAIVRLMLPFTATEA